VLLGVMENVFTDLIADAQEKGLLTTTEKPEILGKYLINLWNGINVTRRMYPGGLQLKEVIDLNLQILR
jgi:TetR/AcrR family transcriptional repressor of nem operon